MEENVTKKQRLEAPVDFTRCHLSTVTTAAVRDVALSASAGNQGFPTIADDANSLLYGALGHAFVPSPIIAVLAAVVTTLARTSSIAMLHSGRSESNTPTVFRDFLV